MASNFPSKFWHYRLSNTVDQSTQRPLWGETRCDLELSKLQSEVVRPWKSGHPFSVNGIKFSSSSSSIQIIWTPQAAIEYMNAEHGALVLKGVVKTLATPSKAVEALADTLQGNSKIHDQAQRRVFEVSDKVDYTNELLIDTERQEIHPDPKYLTPRSAAKPNERQVPAKIFISYSHKDKKFKEELETHLTPMMRNGVSLWSDKQIQPGSKWMNDIEAALAHASVAVLLVTPSFLSSDFIHKHELNPILQRAAAGGMRILWVLVRACAYDETSIKDYQAAHPLNKPLAIMKAERDQAWADICKVIKKMASSEGRSIAGAPSLSG